MLGPSAARICGSRRPGRRRGKRSRDFVALLEEIDGRHGPRPVVLVLDNGPIHTSKLTTEALAARPWLAVEWLPRYAPELNDIERLWRDLKRHHLAHRTFTDAGHLERTIHDAVGALNRERAPTHPCDSLSIAA